MTSVHQPVLCTEVVELLNPRTGDIMIDATLGGGGHAELLLERIQPGGQLLGFEHDADAITRVEERLRPRFGPQTLIVIHDTFFKLAQYCEQHHLSGRVNGILFDLGPSSDQLAHSGRGFSFRADHEPLNLRMDTRAPTDAATLLRTASERTLADIFHEFGEVRGARRLAKRIVQSRKQHPVHTVGDFKRLLASVFPGLSSHRLAPIWQALRISVNQELEILPKALRDSFSVLSSGGRLAVITFHSLEDRIVKQYFRTLRPQGHILTPKPLRPSADECAHNPRARSAKLRGIEKI